MLSTLRKDNSSFDLTTEILKKLKENNYIFDIDKNGSQHSVKCKIVNCRHPNFAAGNGNSNFISHHKNNNHGEGGE